MHRVPVCLPLLSLKFCEPVNTYSCNALMMRVSPGGPAPHRCSVGLGLGPINDDEGGERAGAASVGPCHGVPPSWPQPSRRGGKFRLNRSGRIPTPRFGVTRKQGRFAWSRGFGPFPRVAILRSLLHELEDRRKAIKTRESNSPEVEGSAPSKVRDETDSPLSASR